MTASIHCDLTNYSSRILFVVNQSVTAAIVTWLDFEVLNDRPTLSWLLKSNWMSQLTFDETVGVQNEGDKVDDRPAPGRHSFSAFWLRLDSSHNAASSPQQRSTVSRNLANSNWVYANYFILLFFSCETMCHWEKMILIRCKLLSVFEEWTGVLKRRWFLGVTDWQQTSSRVYTHSSALLRGT